MGGRESDSNCLTTTRARRGKTSECFLSSSSARTAPRAETVRSRTAQELTGESSLSSTMGER